MNFIRAKVEVAVQNGEITDINILKHRHERRKATEAITDEVVEEQRTDKISDATNSSTVKKRLKPHSVQPIQTVIALNRKGPTGSERKKLKTR